MINKLRTIKSILVKAGNREVWKKIELYPLESKENIKHTEKYYKDLVNHIDLVISELEATQKAKKYYVFKKGIDLFDCGALVQFSNPFNSFEEAETFCEGEVDETFIMELRS